MLESYDGYRLQLVETKGTMTYGESRLGDSLGRSNDGGNCEEGELHDEKIFWSR